MNRTCGLLEESSKARYKAKLKYSRNRLGLTVGFLDGNFRCVHCSHPVSYDPLRSGVHNRNHCPYCLWSRHVDLYRAGDRLAACKAPMKPVGLAIKRTRKKYGDQGPGELMVIHRCADCGRISINRVAADDSAEELWEVFQSSLDPDPDLIAQLDRNGIDALDAGSARKVRAQLFGTG
jgi:hypothetical protein